jgi:hypothetical protein
MINSANAIRDPDAEESRFGTEADAFLYNFRQGFWVPAFAGTTEEDFSASFPAR